MLTRVERALTTEMPTPCRPPETAYPPAAELAAGVEDRHDDLDGGLVLGGVLVDGDASTVIDDFDAAVCLDGDLDVVRVAGQGLVDGVVDDLVHQVVQASFAGGSDVHARALADGFQALEDGDVRCAVGLLASAVFCCQPRGSPRIARKIDV